MEVIVYYRFSVVVPCTEYMAPVQTRACFSVVRYNLLMEGSAKIFAVEEGAQNIPGKENHRENDIYYKFE